MFIIYVFSAWWLSVGPKRVACTDKPIPIKFVVSDGSTFVNINVFRHPWSLLSCFRQPTLLLVQHFGVYSHQRLVPPLTSPFPIHNCLKMFVWCLAYDDWVRDWCSDNFTGSWSVLKGKQNSLSPGGAVSHTLVGSPRFKHFAFHSVPPRRGWWICSLHKFVLISRLVLTHAVPVSRDGACIMNLCWSSLLPLSQLFAAFRQTTPCLWSLPDVHTSPHCPLHLF